MPIPASEQSNVKRVPLVLPVGTPLQLDLWVDGASAIAHVSLSQCAPTNDWMMAASFDNKMFDAANGHITQRFRPTLRGQYQFDWQFYVTGSRYKVCARLSVADAVQYRRYVAAGIDASGNPHGTIGIAFT